MMIIKSNGRNAVAIAGTDDYKLLKSVGVKGIKTHPNALAILTRLVNSNVLPEGNY